MPAPFHSNDERTVFFPTLDINIYRFWGQKSCPTGNHYYVKLMVMTVPSAFSFFSVSSYWLQIHNLEDCPSKEDFFFRDLVTSQISYGEIKDEPSSSQAGVLIVISFFLCFTGLIHVEIELHAHRQMLQDLSQPKEEKLELQNTTEDERDKKSSHWLRWK